MPEHPAAARSTRSPARPLLVAIFIALVVAGLVVVAPRLADVPSRGDVATIAWVGALIQLAVLVLVGWLLLPRRRVSAPLVLAAAVAGASFCAGVGILLNQLADSAGIDVRLIAPLSEEVVKLAAVAVVLLLMRDRVHGPLDGLVAGYAVGAGFAVVEDILYSYRAESVAHVWQLVISRAVTGPGTHGVFAGIAGAGLAYLIVTRGSGRAWWVAGGALAAGLGLHLLWDGLGIWLPPIVYLASVLVIYAGGVTLFVITRRLAAAWELRRAGIIEPAR